ncbi:hypothetical protein ACFLR1_00915 [Bacteroidota bacterium]
MNCSVGDNVLMYNGGNVSDDCKIDNHTIVSPGVQIAGHTVIGNCCQLGIGTIVIDNITICSKTITGGGAVVVKDIDAPGLYLGCPAKRIQR